MQKNALNQQLVEQEGFVEKTLRHKGNLVSFFCYTIKDQKGHLHEYDALEHPGASVMIPVDHEGNIYFIKQWRRSSGKVLIELPAGTLDPGEPPEKCAQRELQEEIGYFAKKLTYLGGFFTAPGFCNEYLHLFLAEDLILSPLEGEDTKYIDMHTLSLQKTLEAVDSGLIEDAKTLCGILKYLRHIKQLS